MTLLFNFGLMSLLLLAAQVLRGRVGVLQTYCIPSAIVAGFLALIAGPNGFNWLPFREAETLADYPRMLVIILFATLFPGTQVRQRSPGALIRQVGDTFFYSLASQFGQYGLALLFGLFILAPLFPSLNPAFALMLPSGFAGGPGVATVTAQSLQRSGWDEALSVGLTFATLGQLVGIVGGILLINLAMRLGWTRLVRSPEELPAGLKSGFVPAGQQVACGRETVSSFVLDSFTWHLAIVLAAVMIGQALGDGLKAVWPALDFPVFALAMLSGVLIQVVLDQIGIGRSVDRGTITRIGSLASDFLIAFGICAIQPRVVGAYVVPILLMGLFGVVYSVAIFWFVGRRIYRNYWFERGLFTYGWNTGLPATFSSGRRKRFNTVSPMLTQ
jgi:ESS family glutamate:Na+ symporter